MEIKYNVTGDQRKELVKSISGITGVKAVYKFMPTCNYEIDYFTVTKDGTLLFDDRADSEEVERVLEGIAAAGFECEAPEGKAEEPENAAQDGSVGLTVEVPLDKVQVGNLTKLLDAKGSLIKKALGLESGSGKPNKTKVGQLTQAQVREIAEKKMPDLNAASIEAAMSMVAGTARSMGVTVEE